MLHYLTKVFTRKGKGSDPDTGSGNYRVPLYMKQGPYTYLCSYVNLPASYTLIQYKHMAH